jgi:hypothetical protein
MSEPDKALLTGLDLTSAEQYTTASRTCRTLEVLRELPNPDKQFAVMPDIAHASFHQKNYAICYHIFRASSRSRRRSIAAAFDGVAGGLFDCAPCSIGNSTIDKKEVATSNI